MKKILTATLAFCIFAYALPVITVGAYYKDRTQPDNSKPHTDNTEYRSAIDIWNETMQELYANAEKNASPPADEKQSYDSTTTVTVLIDGITRKITVRDYLIGVVAAEMPASFPIEALKAQAVAARSYMLHKLEQSAEEHEGGARLCDDYTHCTAFFDISDGGEELWGNNADYYAQRICAAVDDTDGVVAVSGGQVIAAVFHSASPDKTEDAKNVWGVSAEGKSETQIADEGLAALEAWMREIGVSMNITELGATEEMIPELVKATFRLGGGYKQMTEEEVAEIFRQSL